MRRWSRHSVTSNIEVFRSRCSNLVYEHTSPKRVIDYGLYTPPQYYGIFTHNCQLVLQTVLRGYSKLGPFRARSTTPAQEDFFSSWLGAVIGTECHTGARQGNGDRTKRAPRENHSQRPNLSLCSRVPVEKIPPNSSKPAPDTRVQLQHRAYIAARLPNTDLASATDRS